MRIMYRWMLSAALLMSALFSYAIPSRPEPQRLVNDFAGLFASYQEDELERMLVAFDDSTSNQITVVTVADLEGYDPAEYATRIGIDWQVGSARFDNGIVLLVKPKTAASSGQVFIAVGYGLEGAVPDAFAKRIIENELIPHFRENDYYGGVLSACDVLMKLASGEISEPREVEEDDTLAIIIATLVVLFLLFCILVAMFGNGGGSGNGGSGGRRPVIYTGPVITTGHNYGGGFGGGFSGGFGGFGGGSFGGGGAGGSW